MCFSVEYLENENIGKYRVDGLVVSELDFNTDEFMPYEDLTQAEADEQYFAMVAEKENNSAFTSEDYNHFNNLIHT